MAQVIKQTNGTILFEEINPEKLDLLTLVGDTKGLDSLSDEKIKEIIDTLCVKSFDEFIKKFDPVIYSYYNANNQRVMYTLKKPESIPDEFLTEIHLNTQNDFLKMLFTLIDAKRSQGLLNVDFKFDSLTDLISPRKVMSDIKQNRKELRYIYSNYIQLEDEDPRKLDLGDKLNAMMEEASINYNNVMALLPLAIEDIKTRLILAAGTENGDAPLSMGVLTMGNNGELKIIEATKKESSSTALVTLDDKVNEGLIEVIGEDYEALNEDNHNDYVKALVTRTFCPLPSTMVTEIDTSKEIENYNTYLEFYRQAKDDFIKTVKPLIEKIMGVKLFFEQYPARLRNMKPTLLIANVKPEMLVKTPNLPRLVTYLNTVNAKNDFTNTIWYAIFPNVAFDAKENTKLTRQRFKGTVDKEDTKNVNSMETFSGLMQTLADYRIQTFFSFSSHEKNTFNAMATEGISRYIDKTVPLTSKPYSEFAIPCFPNFTVIPKDKSGVVLDRKMTLTEDNLVELSKEKRDIMKLWIEGVYVGAAYVAAGIVAAYQDPEYLKLIFKRNVDPQLPGVRFDIEDGDNALLLTTTLAKEITGFTTPIKAEINKQCFGFVFSSENANVNGLPVNNIMVYKARNLLFDENYSVYESIYKTQVTTYVQRVLQNFSGDFLQDKIARFFSSNPSSQLSQWKNKSGSVNSIIGSGDDLTCVIDDENNICTLNFAFNGNIKNLEIETTRTTSTRHV